MGKIEKAVSFAENVANDNRHGYDQIDRLGKYGDYDCSGLVIMACENAGIHVRANGATYTGNMYSAFKKSGFTDVTKDVNTATGAGMMRGDVLLTPNKHTAFYCGAGKMVDARINEKGTTKGGKKGDQTGHEIEIHSYRNRPFKYVLRYTETQAQPTANKQDITNVARAVIRGAYGSGAYRRLKLTQAGFNYKEVQAEVNRIYREKDF